MLEYKEKVRTWRKSDLVAYWPLDDESGTAPLDLSPNGYNATSSGLVRTPASRAMYGIDGRKCAQFDGTNTYIDIYGILAKEPTTLGSISLWAATPDANISDTTAMYLIYLAVDANNYIRIYYDTTAYRFNGAYAGGGTAKSVNGGLLYNVGYGAQWHHFGLTWDATNDELKYYQDGVQQGTTQSSLGTWAGSIAAATSVLGSSSTTAADQFTGWMQHVAIWSVALSDADMRELAKWGR
jgi:hypothetical protein